ncbi:RNA polymerase sigma factor [Candidatus Saccharibacteria bacterium]|nr:RNA polymerase sigma factor [Candidatus Saccharibacteria bacterium]
MQADNTRTDEDIVAHILGGDIDAYALLMQRYETKLHRYVTYLIHDPSAASDVVQDAFIKAYQNLQGFNSRYKFSSWIYRIAHNEAMNAVKKYRLQVDKDVDEFADIEYDHNIGEAFDNELRKEHVHACLKELDAKYRDVIQLVYLEQLKYDEVSDILHIPTSTVGVRLSRAKARLKDICQQKGVTR